MIRGVCYVGDNKELRAAFDATGWFSRATPEKILALFKIGCAGDREADAVARLAARYDDQPDLKALLAKCAPTTYSSNGLPYDVKINRRDASGWVRERHPGLAVRLAEKGLLV